MVLSRGVGVQSRVIILGACIDIVLAIPIIVMGFWLAFRHHINCIKFLEIPILFIGWALVLVSVLGIWAAKNYKIPLVWGYLFLLFLLLLLLLAFVLFAFFVTSDDGAHAVPGANYLEYNLGEYSSWLQDQVNSPLKWAFLRPCVKDQQACSRLNRLYPTSIDFSNAFLTPIQSGCCKPPSACGFTFVRPTQWTTAASGGASSDCGLWSNSGMCYECNTCKAGLLETVRHDWRTVARVCLAAFILLVLVYLLSWSAFLKGSWDYTTRQGQHGFSQPPE